MRSVVLCLLFLIFNLSLQQSYGQSIENVVAAFDGESIIVTYDLIHPDANQKYKVSLFSSHNAFQKPLTLVSGDVGNSVTVGKYKKIVWSVSNELPPYFNDDISFKIKASPIAVANYKIEPFASNGFKRGSSIELKWQGGSPSDQVKIDLLKDNVVLETITQTKNANSYQWEIPKKQKTGSTYALRVTNSNNTQQTSTTSAFTIKPKIPLLVKIAIPVVVAVVVGVLVTGGGNGGTDDPNTNNGLEELPGPINPGGG